LVELSPAAATDFYRVLEERRPDRTEAATALRQSAAAPERVGWMTGFEPATSRATTSGRERNPHKGNMAEVIEGITAATQDARSDELLPLGATEPAWMRIPLRRREHEGF
jgi:hypothetical protein